MMECWGLGQMFKMCPKQIPIFIKMEIAFYWLEVVAQVGWRQKVEKGPRSRGWITGGFGSGLG